jgi:hypothetical protein
MKAHKGTSSKDNKFVEWLTDQLKQKGWTYADLSREIARINPDRPNVSPAISLLMARKRNLGDELAVDIADALQISHQSLFAIARLTRDSSAYETEIGEYTKSINEALSIISDHETRARILRKTLRYVNIEVQDELEKRVMGQKIRRDA